MYCISAVHSHFHSYSTPKAKAQSFKTHEQKENKNNYKALVSPIKSQQSIFTNAQMPKIKNNIDR